MRRVSWFSCGAASAVATRLSKPTDIVYCDTGSEHADNARFMAEIQSAWFDPMKVEVIKSEKYSDTWDVWESKRYLSGIAGAPCTTELKIKPRLAWQRLDDIHIFGYTADSNDMRRAESLREHWPDMAIETPLIDAGITKAACLSLLESAGIAPPLTYALGMPSANCVPCCKASSPAYWALIRQEFPDKFWRYATQEALIGAKTITLNGERIQLRDLPEGIPTTEPIMHECDFLCQLAEEDIK